ncbi:hypothetical protein OAH34_02975, partial [bacterium]|nr:hypothetical protein [bacterium]
MNVQKNNNIGDKPIQVGITTNLWFVVMPFMISLAINLAFWTGNLREIKPIDFLESYLLTVPVTALAITLAQLLFRRSTAKSFAANSLTAATFLYGHMRTLVFQSSLFSRPEIASVLIWVCCIIIIICFARYLEGFSLKVNQPLVIAASLVLVLNTVTIANFHFDAATPTKQKLQAIHTSNHITDPHSQKKLPSIYYVIADGYARADVLKRVYGFDNTPFLNALRERGFYICEKSLSNYPRTNFSLTSSLNSDYLASLLRINQLEENEKSLGKLRKDNKMFITAKQAGYQIVLATNSEYTSGWFPTADIIAAPARQRFKDDLLRLTAIQPFREKIPSSYDPIKVFEANNKRKNLLNTVHFLGNSSKSKTESSRLYLCHLMAPHQPFLFDER